LLPTLGFEARARKHAGNPWETPKDNKRMN